MRKSYLTVIILLFLLTNGVAASNNYYWDNFMENSGVNYQGGEGNFSISQKVKEYEAGKEVEKIDTNKEIRFDYSVLNNTEFNIHLFSEKDFSIHSGKLKYNFLRGNWLNMTGMLGIYLVQEDIKVPSLKLISDQNIFSDNLILYNNYQMYFHEGGLLNLIENGFAYQFDHKSTLKGYMGTFFGSDLSKLRFNFKLGYKYKVNDELDYYAYSYYQKFADGENLHLENIVEFKPVDSFKIKSNIIINTKKDFNNWIVLSGEQQILKNMRLLLEYKREADEKGAGYLKAGLNYSL